MDYTEELKNLLRPLGVYDVDAGVGAAELEAIGGQLTGVWTALTGAEVESSPRTAEGSGLAAWEALLPFIPVWATVADRRRAIAALLRIDGTGFTPAAVNDTVAGCGIRAVVEEADAPMTVTVSFPWNRGEPEDFAALKKRIEQIIPCHLAIEYAFILVLWGELEALVSAWSEIETENLVWRQVEGLGGEE